MSKRSAQHATFTIERDFAAAPARVFKAWSDQKEKDKWFGGPDEWLRVERTMDFRIGGRERSSGGPKGGEVHFFDAYYWDIVPNERIVYAYDMHLGDKRISVSVATVEFKPKGSGTHLVVTEQGVFLDGYDDAGSREHGTRWLLGKLEASLG